MLTNDYILATVDNGVMLSLQARPLSVPQHRSLSVYGHGILKVISTAEQKGSGLQDQCYAE